MSDPVSHPSHYVSSKAECSCGRKIECIEVTKHSSFCIGNAQKYLWRHELKGNPVQDLKKAIFYIEEQIRIYEQQAKTKAHSS